MNTEIIALLEAHGIKPTANRIMVARALTETVQPLSLAELERRIQTIDKSNVFRALTLFRDHHMVHAIEGGGDGTRYELCHSHCDDHDEDQHPHFFCERCQQTFCLDHLHMPELLLPEGFEAHSTNFIIKGVCPHCHHSE